MSTDHLVNVLPISDALIEQCEPVDSGHLLRLSAFTRDPKGGNRAGVWIGPGFPTDERMQAIAAEVGYSETTFAVQRASKAWDVRYFSPMAEVPFCGHATVALGAALGPDPTDSQRYLLHTMNGVVGLEVADVDGGTRSTLTSVDPSYSEAPPELLDTALSLLGWTPNHLDRSIPPAVAYAGAYHLVIALESRTTLAELTYDFDEMKRLMLRFDLTTLQIVWRESKNVFYVRDPFPVGGVVEDPATGSAAAAFGGYLRRAGLVDVPAELTLHQGGDMGRPSELTVTIPAGSGGINVAGFVVPVLD